MTTQTAGRYVKAPLVYMSAHLNTTSLPKLTTKQQAIAKRAMADCGLKEAVEGKFQQVQLRRSSGANQEPTSTSGAVFRHGFLSQDRANALILSPASIEWRTTAYSRYDDVCRQIQEVIAALCSAVNAYQVIPVRELSLTYAGVIASTEGRALTDYFAQENCLLPLNGFQGTENDWLNFGYIQANRIVEPHKRIFISLEELPVIEGKPSRRLPRSLMEPDTRFQLRLQEDQTAITSDHYALLATQAALLTHTALKDLRFRDACAPIVASFEESTQKIIEEMMQEIRAFFEPPVPSIEDMVQKIRSVFGLNLVQVSDVIGVSEKSLRANLVGKKAPESLDPYHKYYDLALEVEKAITVPLKPGLKSVLVDGKTLLRHLKEKNYDREKILSVAREVSRKLTASEKPDVITVEEQRRICRLYTRAD